MTIILWVTFILIRPTYTCNPGQQWQENPSNVEEDVDNGAIDPFFNGLLNDSKKWYAHWPDADAEVNGVKYYDWMKEYKAQQKQKDKDYLIANGGKKKKYPDGVNSDWPSHWQGLGPGIGGVAPPPWAIIKESSGKPDLCYLPPQLGNCKSYTIRWGFNPYRNDCAEFVYSGCEGNRNNFYTKRRCAEVCLNPPESTCIHNPDAKLSNFENWIKHLPHGEF